MKRTNRRKRELQLRLKGMLTIMIMAGAVAAAVYVVRTAPPEEVSEGVSRIRELESQEVSEVEETIREAEEAERKKAQEALLKEAQEKKEKEAAEKAAKEKAEKKKKDKKEQKEAGEKKAEDKKEKAGGQKKEEVKKKEAAETKEKKGQKEKNDAETLAEESVDAVMEQVESGEIDVWSLYDDVFILGDSRSEPFSYYGLMDPSRVFAIKGANLRRAAEGLAQAQSANVPNLIFTFGLNDASGNWATAQDFIAKYEEVTGQYQEVLPDAQIYIASVSGVTDHALAGNPTLQQIPAYNEEIRKLCEEKGYIYIECGSLLTEHQDLYEQDGEHYTRPLYEYWGRMMIREVLLHDMKETASQQTEEDKS